MDQDIPESWYKTTKTVSEIGISDFYQAPMLVRKLKVVNFLRLKKVPQDPPPPVIEPYDEVGAYGGTVDVSDINWGGYGYNYWAKAPC